MKRIQVIKDNVVVNVLSFANNDMLASDNKSVNTQDGDFPAPDGCSLMTVEGADKGWTVSGDTLIPPPPPTPPAPVPGDIKAECQRRIYAVASPDCQMNMTAYVASGTASTSDKAAFNSSLGWVMAMRATYATLATSLDPTFKQDSHWPVCPSDAVALAAKF
jgi:hypothetical protein